MHCLPIFAGRIGEFAHFPHGCHFPFAPRSLTFAILSRLPVFSPRISQVLPPFTIRLRQGSGTKSALLTPNGFPGGTVFEDGCLEINLNYTANRGIAKQP